MRALVKRIITRVLALSFVPAVIFGFITKFLVAVYYYRLANPMGIFIFILSAVLLIPTTIYQFIGFDRFRTFIKRMISIMKMPAEERPVIMESYIGHHHEDHSRFIIGTPDLAGGWVHWLAVYNFSSKKIMNISFSISPYDSDGDVITDSGPDDYEMCSDCDVSAAKRKSFDLFTPPMWYGLNVDDVGISEITVTFADGTTKTFNCEYL